MDAFKRFLGIIWLVLALVVAFFCIFELGYPKLISGSQEDLVFGIITLFILTPLIVFGLGTFGYYALTGEYDEKQ